MSKSYDNTINLGDSPQEIERKAKTMVTDPKRVKLTDPGHPDECNVFSYYSVFAPEQKADVRDWCENAKKGCTDCKKNLAVKLSDYLKEIRERREELAKDKDRVRDILNEGRKKAQTIARQTMSEVREVVFG